MHSMTGIRGCWKSRNYDRRRRAHWEARDPCVSPSISAPQQSTIRGFGASHYAASSQLLVKNGMRQLREITDGFECIDGWRRCRKLQSPGDPDNMRDPAAGFGTGPDQFCNPPSQIGVVQFLLAQGSVRAMSVNIDAETLKAIACPDHGGISGAF